jgi:hypothetical protein
VNNANVRKQVSEGGARPDVSSLSPKQKELLLHYLIAPLEDSQLAPSLPGASFPRECVLSNARATIELSGAVLRAR